MSIVMPWLWRDRMNRALERTAMTIAWLLPTWLVTWVFIRVVAHATTGKYGATEVPKLTAMEALDRWTVDKGSARSN